ncbi:MAG: hypothetical protein KUG80_06420 [Gammaproteobacteria bacterium]|nr:hypothetical protein [Gammaproteobacteria bacterium]
MATSPRCADDSKPDLLALPTFSATKVEGVLVEGADLFLECVLEKIIDDFGENSLITGKIVAAHVDENYLCNADQGDQQLLASFPLLESPSTEGDSQKAMFHLLEKHLQPLGFKVKYFSGKRLGVFIRKAYQSLTRSAMPVAVGTL